MLNGRRDHKQILRYPLSALWHCPKHHCWLPHTNRQPEFLRGSRRRRSGGHSWDGLYRKRTIVYHPLARHRVNCDSEWFDLQGHDFRFRIRVRTNFEGIWPKYDHYLMGLLELLTRMENVSRKTSVSKKGHNSGLMRRHGFLVTDKQSIRLSSNPSRISDSITHLKVAEGRCSKATWTIAFVFMSSKTPAWPWSMFSVISVDGNRSGNIDKWAPINRLMAALPSDSQAVLWKFLSTVTTSLVVGRSGFAYGFFRTTRAYFCTKTTFMPPRFSSLWPSPALIAAFRWFHCAKSFKLYPIRIPIHLYKQVT